MESAERLLREAEDRPHKQADSDNAGTIAVSCDALRDEEMDGNAEAVGDTLKKFLQDSVVGEGGSADSSTEGGRCGALSNCCFDSETRGARRAAAAYRDEQNALARRVLPFYSQRTFKTKSSKSLLSKTKTAPSSVIDIDAKAGLLSTNENAAALTRRAINASFGANVVLLVLKAIAAISTGSMAIVASLVDSALDLVSGWVLMFTQKYMRKREPYLYPESKARFEPIGIIVFASIMGVASLQIVGESVRAIVDGLGNEPPEMKLCGDSNSDAECVPAWTIWTIMGTTVAVKALLLIFCNRVHASTGSSAVATYAEDHRNDCVTNAAALIALWLWFENPEKLWWCDPLGAIMLSLWIVVSWAQTGMEHVSSLAGKTAPVELLQTITHAAFAHSHQILAIDTVRAYGFGIKYLAEIDIVLPKGMSVQVAHDIAESLQFAVEKLDEIQRAFVHIDFETEHSPHFEHNPDAVEITTFAGSVASVV